jgi:Methane oxygenase PmoA
MKALSPATLFFGGVLLAFHSAGNAASLTLRQDDATNAISAFRQSAAQPILTQNARPDCRPFLHPIVAPDGRDVLAELSPAHHKHQTGLYWGLKQVNGRDYFHNPGAGFRRKVSSAPLVAEGESVSGGLQ